MAFLGFLGAVVGVCALVLPFAAMRRTRLARDEAAGLLKKAEELQAAHETLAGEVRGLRSRARGGRG